MRTQTGFRTPRPNSLLLRRSPSRMSQRSLLIACVLLVAVACGNDAGNGTDTSSATAPTNSLAPTTSEAPSTTPEPTSTTVVVTTAPTDTLTSGLYAPDANPLPAGTYTTEAAGVPLSFTVTDGWTVQIDDGAGMGLVPAGAPPMGYVGIVPYEGRVFDDPCGQQQAVDVGPSAEALFDWLSTNPQLEVVQSGEVTVGGVAAPALEVRPIVPSECTDPPWLYLIEVPVVGDYHLVADTTAQLIAVQLADSTILVAVEGSTETWDEMKSLSTGFLESLQFGS